MPTTPDLDPASLLPPFESSLPATLRVSGERALLRFHALTRETYSTERFLSDSPDNIASVLNTIQVASGNLPLCEEISPELVRYSTEHGLELASAADTNWAIDLIEAALRDVIEPYPFLRSAVSELAWRCHIVLAQSDNYDVSFSDPAIPFSIFVSAPARNDRSSILRVAENLIHETMHLQLTLFEGLSPLVDTASTWSVYSPWKRQKRPAQGVLHGLYVFCTLRWMWRQISQTTRNRTDRDFALRRISEIDEEVSAVRALEESPALTEDGSHFLHQLLVAY
jgi:HEXXH motif-containing protein